jgi:hypothetical protein|tara:strand:+ start:18031 stop:19032 length:1002 start_codon:yes stop_codon:yes gene_type:complete
MDKNNPDENAAGKFSKPAIKRKPLSKAAIERRRIKRLQRQFPTGDFSQTGSDPEPGRPNNLSTNAKAYILDELRRRLRSGKKAYGKHMTKDVMKIFGCLPNNEPADLENWINWLCRNREELISGKYAPGTLNGASHDPEGTSAEPEDEKPIFSEPHKQLPEIGNVANQSATTNEVFPLKGEHGSSFEDQNQLPNNLAEAEVIKRLPGDPMPTANHDHGLAPSFEVPKEIPNQVARHASGGSAGQPHIKNVADAAHGSVAKMPDKFDFYFKKDGAGKANKFFGSIRFNESLEQVLENARALASDKAAIDEVLNRGPKEREYLIKAMRDLQVPLP